MMGRTSHYDITGYFTSRGFLELVMGASWFPLPTEMCVLIYFTARANSNPNAMLCASKYASHLSETISTTSQIAKE